MYQVRNKASKSNWNEQAGWYSNIFFLACAVKYDFDTIYFRLMVFYFSQPAFTCSKLEQLNTRKKMWNMFNVTIKPPKRRQCCRFCGFIVNFEHISHLCSSSSIVNFEHVIAGWVTWIRLLALFFALVTNMQMKVALHLSVIKAFWFHFVCCKWLRVTSEAAIRGVLRALKINS